MLMFLIGACRSSEIFTDPVMSAVESNCASEQFAEIERDFFIGYESLTDHCSLRDNVSGDFFFNDLLAS